MVLSIIQIIPNEVKVIEETSASSTWTQGNWSKPDSYASYKQLDINESTGYLKLHFGEMIYIADSYNCRIVETMMDGSYWNTYGTLGSGTGNFNYPIGIYYDNSTGFLYISDYNNHRIVKTQMGGKGWTAYGTKGSGIGNFNNPLGIHYDSSSGFIYIADGYNYRIIKTKINGSGWTSLGVKGTGEKEFSYPADIYYDNTMDLIYITDWGNYRIVKTKINGSGWATFGSYGNGTGQFKILWSMDYNTDTKDFYLTDRLSDQIVKTQFDGSGWTTFGTQGSGKGQFSYPGGIDYDKKTGYIYIADYKNHRMVRTTMNGSGWKSFGTWGTGTNQFYFPQDIAFAGYRYCPNGFMRSNKFNMNGSAELMKISWIAETPKNTSIDFQIKTGENESDLKAKSFVGPNGSKNSYYKTSGSKVWLGHSGDRWIQYKAFLSTADPQKSPVLKDVTIEYNLLPKKPAIITPADKSMTNNNMTTFTWQHIDFDSSGQAGYHWQMDDNHKFKSINYDSTKISSSKSSYNHNQPIADGIWYWRLRTQDSDDGWGAFSKPRKILIDTQKPTSEIKIPKNNTYYNDLNNISGKAADPDVCSGVNKTEITIKRIDEDKYWNGDFWVNNKIWLQASGFKRWSYNTSTVSWISGSTYQVQSKTWDNVSNSESPSEYIEFGFDSENPISNIDYPNDNTSYNSVTAITGSSIDIGGSGVKRVEIAIKKISNSKYWTGESWVVKRTWLKTSGIESWSYDTRSIKWGSSNEFLILSKAIDNVDFIETPSMGNRFLYDTEKPFSNIEFPLNKKFYNKVDAISGNASDTGDSGIEKVEIFIKRNSDRQYWTGKIWDSELQWLTAEGLDNWTYDTGKVEWTSDEYYTISSRVIDNAKNYEAHLSENLFMFDNTSPGQSFIINDDAKFTNNGTVELTLDFSDTGSGVEEMSFRADDEDWTAWEPINFSKSFNLTSGDDTKYVYFRVKDRAGNIGESTSKSIILDTSPPDGSALINNGDMFTNENSVVLSLSGIDDLSNITGMSFSSDILLWSDWEPFIEQKNFILSSGDGEKIVYCRLMDSAGNIGISSDTIILDTSPPHSLSIIINNGASETKSIKVSLKLYAVDDLSGVDQMSFCTQGGQWSSWEEFKDTISYELTPGNGQKIILFRVSDKAGNIAIPVHSEINLNMATPSQEKSQEKSTSYFYFWLILITVILITIVVLITIIIVKRRRKTKQEALTTKPTEALESIPTPDKLTPVSQPPQLPPTATIGIPGTAQELPTPQSTVSQNLPQVKPIPQLPPAEQQPQTTATQLQTQNTEGRPDQ